MNLKKVLFVVLLLPLLTACLDEEVPAGTYFKPMCFDNCNFEVSSNAETVVVNDASGDNNNNNLWRIRLIKEWVNGDSISFLCGGLPDTLAGDWYTIATNRKKKKERSKVTVKLTPNRNASERTLIITLDASGFMDSSFKIKQAGTGN